MAEEMTGAQAAPAGAVPVPPVDDWAVFANPATPVAFLQAWFRLLCREAGSPPRAVLLLRTTEGAFAPIAHWPASVTPPPAPAEGTEPPPDPLAQACDAALKSAAIALRPAGIGQRAIGCPVVVDGAVEALIGMIVPELQLREAARRLHWGAGWLYGMIAERQAREEKTHAADTAAALRVLAAIEEGDGLEAGLRAFVNEVQPLIGADRVAIALLQRGRLRLRALSQTADPEIRAAAMRSLVQAMEEARLQIVPLTWPAPATGQTVAVLAAHASHAAPAGVLGMISLPLAVEGRVIGVVSAERMTTGTGGGRFSEPERDRLAAMAALCAPVLNLYLREHRLVSGRGRRGLARAVAAVFGRRSPGIKLAAVVLVLLGLLLAGARTELRIPARAELRGAVQRVVVAPFDGFVAQAPLRAGDRADAGAVLAVLDDTDLRLDLLRWESERARLEQEKSTALAAGERAKVAASDAEIARVSADLDLARSRLARVAIRAPFDGLVIEGDLSQRLGAPVRQGEELFRLAAGQDLRLDLVVGEYDIALIRPGAPGTVALSGMSGAVLHFEVTRIAEVAAVEREGNAFRVEARLTDPPDTLPTALRPGLEGVAKIDAGRAGLVPALLRPVTERLRILLWRWQP